MSAVSTRGSIVWDSTVSGRSPFRNNCHKHKIGLPSNLGLSWNLSHIASPRLPKFKDLTNDDERELKAMGKKPGTYNVVYNPASFVSGSEDEADDDDMEDSEGLEIERQLKREDQGVSAMVAGVDGSSNWGLAGLNPLEVRTAVELDRESSLSPSPEAVILKRFEEPTTASTTPAPTSKWSTASTPENESRQMEVAVGVRLQDVILPDQLPHDDVLLWNSLMASEGQEEAQYMEYYRVVLSSRMVVMHDKGLIQPTSVNPEGVLMDVFEQESKEFPPLFHAIVALAALSSSVHSPEGITLDALQHYQKALPVLQTSLKSALDLSSDGALYTHFLLLIYEIMAADFNRQCLWQENLKQLLNILLARFELIGKEKLPLLVWYLTIMDAYAALTACGEGELVTTLADAKLLPEPGEIAAVLRTSLCGSGSDPLLFETDIAEPELEGVIRFHQNIMILATKLGRLSRKMRRPASSSIPGSVATSPTSIAAGFRMDPIEEFQIAEEEAGKLVEELKAVELERPWVDPVLSAGVTPAVTPSESTPVSSDQVTPIPILESIPLYTKTEEILEHATALHNACIIFAHTTLRPLQRISHGPQNFAEIDHAIKQIIQQANSLASRGVTTHQCRFMLFPLFLAGAESSDPQEKNFAANYVRQFQDGSLGRNPKVVHELLQELYQMQQQAALGDSGHWDVDWQDFMDTKGWRVVIYDI